MPLFSLVFDGDGVERKNKLGVRSNRCHIDLAVMELNKLLSFISPTSLLEVHERTKQRNAYIIFVAVTLRVFGSAKPASPFDL